MLVVIFLFLLFVYESGSRNSHSVLSGIASATFQYCNTVLLVIFSLRGCLLGGVVVCCRAVVHLDTVLVFVVCSILHTLALTQCAEMAQEDRTGSANNDCP